ncbi:MAG TPA: hypothetical protein VFU13_22925 [Steroidobacteraceae bacterium]|nr:hypothetical protein [Steroidobacteraceae bacterium]
MRNHWAASAIVCALIATFPANLAAQTSTPASAQATTPVDNLAAWGPYARLAGQIMYDVNPSGQFYLRWRWETPGEAMVLEWYRVKNSDKPVSSGTLRLGPQPGTIIMKGNFMMGKEWVGTLHDDGSVSYVGKGLLKMRYTIRVDEQGNYEETYSNGYVVRYAPGANSATPVAVAQTPPATPAPSPAPVSAPTPAPAAPEKPAPVVAKQQPVPPAKPIKAPRQLTEEDTKRIWKSVQASRVRSLEQARQNELARQEAAQKAAIQAQIWAAQQAQREAEEAEAEAELEAERQQKAAAWNQMTRANEQALNNSLQNLRDNTARIQAQAQAQQQARQSAPVDPLGAAERQRQVELIRQANQRQDDDASRYAAQRQQSEQPRADAPTSTGTTTSQQRSSDAGRASTDTDANRCVSSAEVRVNDTSQGNTAAYVTNGCATPVDVKVCLMTDTKWNCGVTWGLASQKSWSHSSFHATGAVFVDAKVAGSSRALRSPN